MQQDRATQSLIDAFFAALELRNLEECATVLAQLQVQANVFPSAYPWFLYFKGVLANECDHDWAEAERIFASLLHLLQTDADLPLHGRVLLALGVTFEHQGRWTEALATYQQSLSAFTQLSQPLDQARAWKNMALCIYMSFTQGDFGQDALHQAISYCRSALDLLVSMSQADVAWLEGTIWNALGLVYGCLGEWDQALASHQRDLEICRSNDDRYGIGIAYLNLGEVYHRRGPAHWPEALESYQHALTIIRKFQNRYLETDVLANLGFLHQDMGEYALALDYYNQAIAIIEELRAGVSSEQARAGFFATTVDTYANAVLLCLKTGHTVQAFDYVERARSRAFLDTLTLRSPDLARTVEAATLTLAQVQARLPDDALLLEYFTTGLLEVRENPATGQTSQRHRFPPAHTLLFAITRDTVEAYDTGLAPDALCPSQVDTLVESHFLEATIRRTLYERLIAPAANVLPGKRRLYLAPHGPLHYIPFQALIAPDGATLLREDGPQIIYGPSATVLFRAIDADQATRMCLVLGYNGSGENRLHFGEEEARSVARLTGGDIITGSNPKKVWLYDRAPQYRLLHFSCHGAFDPENPLASALHLAPNEDLTALDVLNHMHLNCDLVTLSACESGLSRVRRGDELIGLVRAFMYAGAPALVCTLWRVDERSTRILMERFYQEIQAGVDFAEALKRAQLYLRCLTHKQVLEILIHCLTEEILVHAAQPQTASTQRDVLALAQQQAGTYAKSLNQDKISPQGEALSGAADDEQIFADPRYWAPFILIGESRPASAFPP
ncbi:MAG: CHAT domain-containing protein [Chloroflexales bacterium]|nr:CHAT domain-containing protein [Chloroflexales bacterium]